MGWSLIKDLKTGETKLLGEPELMNSPPPEELGEAVYARWKKLHPKYSNHGESDE